jgi:hypothetical protein
MAILDVRPAWALSGGETLAQLDALHAEIARLQTRRLELIASIDQTGYAKEIGAADTVQLLAFRHRLDPPAVRRDVKLAKALPKYAMVSAALPDPAAPTSTDGSIQYGDPATNRHETTGQSKAADHRDATAQGTATDLGEAADLDAAAGRERATRPDAVAEQAAGPAGELDQASAATMSRCSALLTDGLAGAATEESGSGGAEGRGSANGADGRDGVNAGEGTGGEGAGGEGSTGGVRPVLLHPAQAEAIVSALEQVPARAMVPAEDMLEAEAQLVEAARHLSPGELRRLGAKVRDLLDTDGPEPAEDAAAAREALWLKTASKGVRFGGFLANENAELLRVLIEAGAGPKKTPDGQRDPRSRTKRQADALTAILNAAAGSGNAAPGHGGIAPHLNLTMDFFDLKKAGADATGDVHFGDGLSAAAVRRLACEAGVIPVVLGSNSEPLDVGREERFVTKAIRRALIARDKGCVICGAPPDQCDVHHVEHWIDGGATAVGNLVLLCKPNHRDVHRGDWVIQIVDGTVQVTRPGWAEPDHPQPAHPEPGLAESIWGGDPAERTWVGDPSDPDHRRYEPGGPGEPAQDDPTASGSPADGSPLGGWRQGGRGSGAGKRAWPWSGDPPPLTKEAADRLNPWGDDQPRAMPTRRDEKVRATATTEAWPWGDDDQPRATPARRDEKVRATATTEAWPWGDSKAASPGP